MMVRQDLSAAGSSGPVGEQAPVWRHARQSVVRPLGLQAGVLASYWHICSLPSRHLGLYADTAS